MPDPFDLAAIAGAFVIGAALLVIAANGVVAARRRRAQHHAQATVRKRLDDVAAMPAPDELPRADDVTKATRRRMTRRTHPVPRKRGSRRWGQ